MQVLAKLAVSLLMEVAPISGVALLHLHYTIRHNRVKKYCKKIAENCKIKCLPLTLMALSP